MTAAADLGSFSGAAVYLNVEVSAISRTVRELEDSLGVALFERLPRGIRLTMAGKNYVTAARDVLARLDRAGAEARAASKGQTGNLSIGYVWSLARGSAADLLTRYRSLYPNVMLHLVEAGPLPMFHRLERGELDVVLTATASRETLYKDGLNEPETLPLWTERLYAIAPAEELRTSLDWSDLAQHDLLYRRTDAAGPFSDYIKAIGGPLLTFVPHDCSHEGLVGLVAAGLGWSLTPESLARSDLVRVRFIPITSLGAVLQVVAIWRQRTDNPALRRFLDLAKQHYPAKGFIALESYDAPSRTRDLSP